MDIVLAHNMLFTRYFQTWIEVDTAVKLIIIIIIQHLYKSFNINIPKGVSNVLFDELEAVNVHTLSVYKTYYRHFKK